MEAVKNLQGVENVRQRITSERGLYEIYILNGWVSLWILHMCVFHTWNAEFASDINQDGRAKFVPEQEFVPFLWKVT